MCFVYIVVPLINIIFTYITYYDKKYIQKLHSTSTEGENVEKTAVHVRHWRKSKPV